MDLVFCLCLIGPLPEAAISEAQALQLEKAAVNYRRSIQRGHIVISHTLVRSNDPNGDRTRERRSTIWFDGDKVRNDVMLRFIDEAEPHRELSCRHGESEDHFVSYSQRKLEHGVLAVKIEKMVADANPLVYAVVDPRCLGLIPDNVANLAKYHLETILGRPDRKGLRASRGVWRGEKCVRLEFNLAGRSKVTACIVPAWGHGVARVERVFNNPGMKVKVSDSVECEYGRFGAKGTWFPRKCVYRREIDGVLREQEEANVDVKSLNEPLPKDVFRLKGMDIPPGTPVIGPKDATGKRWDGEKIVRMEPKFPSSNANRPSQSGFGKPLLLFGSLGTGVLGAAALIIYFRRRLGS